MTEMTDERALDFIRTYFAPYAARGEKDLVVEHIAARLRAAPQPPAEVQGGGDMTECGHSKYDPCHNCEPLDAPPSAPVGVPVGVVREYLDARACYDPALKHPNSPEGLRLREARNDLDAALYLAQQPSAAPALPLPGDRGSVQPLFNPQPPAEAQAQSVEWVREWQGSGPQRGFHIREATRLHNNRVVAYLGDQVDSGEVDRLIAEHNGKHPNGEPLRPAEAQPEPNWCRTCGRRPHDPVAALCPDTHHRKASPPSAPVEVEGLVAPWEKRAGELNDEGLYGCCAETYEQCAAQVRALSQQPTPVAPVGVEGYLVERLHGDGYGPARRIVDAAMADPTDDLFWSGPEAQARHRVTPLVPALAQQPSAAPAGVEGLPAKWRAEADEIAANNWACNSNSIRARADELENALAQQPAATLPDVGDDDLTVAYMAGRHDGRKEAQREAEFIAGDAIACTACGGSGHRDDQQPAAVDEDWRKKAAEWLEAKAVEQEAANQKWPEHAACYKEWRDRPGILRHLAIQVLAAQQGGES